MSLGGVKGSKQVQGFAAATNFLKQPFCCIAGVCAIQCKTAEQRADVFADAVIHDGEKSLQALGDQVSQSALLHQLCVTRAMSVGMLVTSCSTCAGHHHKACRLHSFAHQHISVVEDLWRLDQGYLAQPGGPFSFQVQHVGQYNLQGILLTNEVCKTAAGSHCSS